MKYSIIIPTLNEELYVGKLLSCLIGQTFKNFEVIVVDAKSDDKTQKVIKGFEEFLTIRIIESEERNVAHQRNLGVKHAKSENIIFLDADGAITSDFLEKINRYVSMHNVDVLTAWVSPISTNLIDHGMFFVYNAIYARAVKKFKPAGGGAFLYIKKSVFKAVGGFDEKIALAEDFDLISRAFNKGYKFELLKDPRIKTSARRIEKEGRFRYITNLLKNNVYYHLMGPIYDSKFANYVMEGGSWYAEESEESKKKKRFGDRLKSIRTLRYKLDPKKVKKVFEYFKDF